LVAGRLGPGWKHIAAVRDKQELKIYVDGRLAASGKLGKQPLNVSNDGPLQIGSGQQGFFSGKIREVRLYSRALSREEVRSMHR